MAFRLPLKPCGNEAQRHEEIVRATPATSQRAVHHQENLQSEEMEGASHADSGIHTRWVLVVIPREQTGVCLKVVFPFLYYSITRFE
jgi:hypothetical protein